MCFETYLRAVLQQVKRHQRFQPVPRPRAHPAPSRATTPAAARCGRDLLLLDAVLGSGREGLRVVDLCRAAGLERATVHRLLATLVESGYAAQRGRFRYVAGPRLAAMAQPAGMPNVAMRLRPVLERVSATCDDATFAIVREGPASHCIARHVGAHPVQILVIQVGTRQPLGEGAAGLALLSALPDDEVNAAMAANALVLGRYGGMTPERMALLVRATRERGWSVIGDMPPMGCWPWAWRCTAPRASPWPRSAWRRPWTACRASASS